MRGALLTLVALGAAPVPGMGMAAKNARKAQAQALLSHVGGALRLLVGEPKAPAPLPRRLLAFSFAGALLRCAGEAAQDRVLEEMVPPLFGPFLGGPGPGGAAAPDARALPLPAAFMGDLLRGVAQARYGSKDSIVRWLRGLLSEGFFLPSLAAAAGVERRLLESTAHGLWHPCPCERSAGAFALFLDDEGEQGVSSSSSSSSSNNNNMSARATRALASSLQRVSSLSPQSALVQRMEREVAAPPLPGFRRQFLHDLALPAALLAPFIPPSSTIAEGSGPRAQRQQLAEARARAGRLLRLLAALYSPPRCSCGRAGAGTGGVAAAAAAQARTSSRPWGPCSAPCSGRRGPTARAGEGFFSPASRWPAPSWPAPWKGPMA